MEHVSFVLLGLMALSLAFVAACSDPEAPADPAAVTKPQAPVPSSDELMQGYQVYKSTCASCHGKGRDGAPLVAKADAWAERIKQGTDVLYQRAIDGWIAPSGAEMPARGGEKLYLMRR